MFLRSAVLVALAVSLGCAGILVKSENPLVVATMEDALNYDRPPTVVTPARPAYPDFAKEVRAEGRVILKVLVLETGKIGAIQVMESSHPLLVENAVDAVGRTVFSPALRDGVPVPATVVMPFTFSLDPNFIRTSITEEQPPDIGNPGIDMNDRSRREEPEPHLGK